jgi:enediyne biosynthesis protein E4
MVVSDWPVRGMPHSRRMSESFVWLLVFAIAGCNSSATPVSTTAPFPTTSVTAVRKPVVLSRVFDLRLPSLAEKQSAMVASPVFDEVAPASGLRHTYTTGDKSLLLMVQPTGGGCGWIDYDGDGLWDLYLNQGGDPSQPPSPDLPSDQLFRNLGEGRFEPVTVFANVDERDYSQGVAVGDFDNDGFSDILITNVGICTLFRNQGDGTFQDVAGQALEQLAGWHSSAAWGDVDRDGDLDLYVCRYVNFDRFHPQICRAANGGQRRCQPNEIDPRPDELYLNEGDGTFKAVARERGVFGTSNKALGVAIADFDNDEWPDIYVANDATPNFLFLNQGDGQFLDKASELGCAVAADGRPQASMGVAVGDYDHNGFLDLYLTHYEGEWNTLYKNLGSRGFSDVTASVGGVSMTLPLVGFGTVMEDFNHDGNEDLVIANGHLDDPGHLGIELAMPPQLFSFNGSKLVDNSARGGDYFSHRRIGRGMATADYDGDGDLDVAIVHQDSPVALLQNNSSQGRWLQLRFVGRTSNRQGIGVRVTLRCGNDVFMRELAGGTSYCSSHQPVLSFGLGDRKQSCDLTIRWPNGKRQSMSNVTLDRIMVVVEPWGDDS